MQITLSKAELDIAIRNYVYDIVNIKDDTTVTITITSEGASVEITKKSDAVNEPKKEETATTVTPTKDVVEVVKETMTKTTEAVVPIKGVVEPTVESLTNKRSIFANLQ